MPTIFDAPDSPIVPASIDSVGGGFVNLVEPHLLKNDQATRLLNADPTFEGRSQKRLGPQPLGCPGTVGGPCGLHEYADPFANLQLLYSQWGNNLYSSPGDASWTRRASGVSLYPSGHAACQGKAGGVSALFMATCDAYTANVSLPYDSLTCIDSSFAFTATIQRPRSIAWFQNRLFAFNLAASGPDFLAWSKVLDGRDFTNGETVQIGDSGDPGVAVVPMRDGTPRLLLFSEKSIYELELYWGSDGYYPTTANQLDFTKSQLRPITLSAGCVSTRALTWVPGINGGSADLMFLSRDGIRTLSRASDDTQGGAAPPLSLPVQATIDRINWAAAHRSVATFFGRFAYFAIPVDGGVDPNFILAFDPQRSAWHEYDLQIAAFAHAKISNTNNLYFLSATSGTETNLGANGSGVTNGYHVYQYGVNLYDPFHLPVQFDWQTKDFTWPAGSASNPGDGLQYRKSLLYLDFALQSAATHASLLFQYKLDADDSWSDLASVYIDPQEGYPRLNVTLPFTFSTGKVIRRSLSLRHLRPAYKAQFRIKDTTSFSRLKIINLTVRAIPKNPKFGSIE